MSEIQSLESRIRVLSHSVDVWNELMLWGLAVAALAAVFVVVATRIIVTRTSRLSTTQELLSTAKDRQLELDLRDKDLKIAEVEKENLKLLAAMASRDLSKEQQAGIRLAVQGFSGRPVIIRSYPREPESARLIVELKASLEPPLRVEDETGTLEVTWATPSTLYGIKIIPEERDRKLAEALIKALGNVGLSVAPLDPSGTDLQTTEILVGMKPPVALPPKP